MSATRTGMCFGSAAGWRNTTDEACAVDDVGSSGKRSGPVPMRAPFAVFVCGFLRRVACHSRRSPAHHSEASAHPVGREKRSASGLPGGTRRRRDAPLRGFSRPTHSNPFDFPRIRRADHCPSPAMKSPRRAGEAKRIPPSWRTRQGGMRRCAASPALRIRIPSIFRARSARESLCLLQQ